MKFKLLLFSLLLSCGILSAQEVIRSLVITEARMNRQGQSYVEITNMGSEPVNLSQFEFGKVGAWNGPIPVDGDWTIEDWFEVGENDYIMLPDVVLEPGESYVIASVEDWRPEMHAIDPLEYDWFDSKRDVAKYADYLMHYRESPAGVPSDSVSDNYQVMETWNGRDCWYLRHHVSEDDSVVIDQVGGVFDDPDTTNYDQAYDVAGFADATGNAVLVRKFNIKTGNLDFANAKGVSLEESEWIPIPFLGDASTNDGFRASFWTMGNHGDYQLDESTLVSSTIDVNWDDGILTVPWGVRRDDSLMFQFDYTPGLAWHYHYLANHEDSAYLSARTGDSITIYMCGNELQEMDFRIEVAPPTEDANMVVPKNVKDDDGNYGAGTAGIHTGFCQATYGVPDMDTIKHINGITGIPFATRTDSLLKYLEKAPNATWEFVFKDGLTRTDLVDGDILKVTAENGDVKEYYIKVDKYRPSHNALLGSITWPDIPDDLRDLYGWMGDTIPNFAPTTTQYQLQIQPDIDNIPALVAKPQHLNATVEVDRADAITFVGNVEERTVSFTSTAEDDTSVMVYEVQMSKIKLGGNTQPYNADPFISQFVFRDQWANTFIEICNPGNQPLDLSDYMFFHGYINNPADAIISSELEEDDWLNRYRKYIPGYKWQTQDDWEVERYIAEQDLNVQSIVQPGDVFVMAHLQNTGNSDGQNWPARDQWDIDFGNNPWNEDIAASSVVEQWWEANFYIFKILNDSVKQGLKPATDPNDFELIEAWGSGDGTRCEPVGVQLDQIQSYTRKPQYYQGHPEFGASYGPTQAESEWTMTNRAYYGSRGHSWPQDILLVTDGLGSHFLDPVTVFISTISSPYYKVSDGYSLDEEILGVTTGTTVSVFKDRLVKEHPDQSLTLLSGADRSELDDATELVNGDILKVLSADSVNITEYILSVGDQGLSDDAVLTSGTYTINVDGENGTIEGFAYGTTIRDILSNVTVPDGAKLTVIDDKGAYVPIKRLNFDTLYVDVQANDQTYFEVTAEDFITKIVYQLRADIEPSDAFVTSSVYAVDQDSRLIDLVPPGTTVATLISNLIPSRGATIQIVDKLGDERNSGYIVLDDKIVVTAQDEETTNVYYLTMLGQKEFLAYLLSSVYEVDQLTLTVYVRKNQQEIPMVSELLSAIELSPGATIQAMNSDGAAKGDDDLIADGDMLRVTAGNGVTVANYSINLVITSIDNPNSQISIYPNPTSDLIYVEGLETGTRIQVYNAVGMTVQDRIVKHTVEVISLQNQSKGLYFIVVSNNDDVVGRYKVILK